MNKLTFSHTVSLIKDSPKGKTLYLFDIWSLELTEDLFNKISSHSNTFVSNDFTEDCLADHCKFLVKEVNKELRFTEDFIRVSIASLVDLRFNNQHILFFNKNKAKPFGGAYLFDSDSKFIKNKIINLDDPSSLDLRFKIKKENISDLLAWFKSKTEREISPFRELKEELSEENNILTPSEWSQLESDIK